MVGDSPTTSLPKRPLTTAGERYGRLVSVGPAGRINGRTRWRFLCDCGRETTADASNVRAGNTTSCGCRRAEHQRNGVPKHFKHGQSNTPSYGSWRAMRDRCGRPTHTAFANYGGRGVKVCERWQTFAHFLADMGPRPPGMSLDRYPDKNGNYEPGNVRWATDIEQNRNKRITRMVTIMGRTLPLAEAADLYGITLARVKARIRNGWDDERALTTPIDDRYARCQTAEAMGEPSSST